MENKHTFDDVNIIFGKYEQKFRTIIIPYTLTYDQKFRKHLPNIWFNIFLII